MHGGMVLNLAISGFTLFVSGQYNGVRVPTSITFMYVVQADNDYSMCLQLNAVGHI